MVVVGKQKISYNNPESHSSPPPPPLQLCASPQYLAERLTVLDLGGMGLGHTRACMLAEGVRKAKGRGRGREELGEEGVGLGAMSHASGLKAITLPWASLPF